MEYIESAFWFLVNYVPTWFLIVLWVACACSFFELLAHLERVRAHYF